MKGCRKIVVTGALGHIGSRIIRDLPEACPDALVVMIDNMLTQRYCSLFGLPADGRYRFIQTDVLTAELHSLLEGADVVGLTSGASAPEWLVDRMVGFLRDRGFTDVEDVHVRDEQMHFSLPAGVRTLPVVPA